jgi:hypothetical protein
MRSTVAVAFAGVIHLPTCCVSSRRTSQKSGLHLLRSGRSNPGLHYSPPRAASRREAFLRPVPSFPAMAHFPQ